jgi:hypothetical protein
MSDGEKLLRGLAFLRALPTEEFYGIGFEPDSNCDIAFRDWKSGCASRDQLAFIHSVARVLNFAEFEPNIPKDVTPERFAQLALFALRVRGQEALH